MGLAVFFCFDFRVPSAGQPVGILALKNYYAVTCGGVSENVKTANPKGLNIGVDFAM